jgi:hypothetical protein
VSETFPEKLDTAKLRVQSLVPQKLITTWSACVQVSIAIGTAQQQLSMVSCSLAADAGHRTRDLPSVNREASVSARLRTERSKIARIRIASEH